MSEASEEEIAAYLRIKVAELNSAILTACQVGIDVEIDQITQTFMDGREIPTLLATISKRL